MATAAASPVRLGDLLVREGLISKKQLDEALTEQRNTGARLGYCLVKMKLIQEIEITKMLAKQYRMPAVDLSRFEVDPAVIKLVRAEVAVKNMVLPLKREGRTLTIAMADPSDVATVDDLKFMTRYDIFPVIAGEYTLKEQIEKYYEQTEAQLDSLLKDIEAGEDLEIVEEEEEDQGPVDVADDAPVVKLINAILTEAVRRGVSDVHVEPFEHEIRIRYRLDGSLQEVMKPPVKLKADLTSRIKIMSNLNIAEKRLPQDGRIKLKMGKRVIDFRVSTLPVIFG